MKNNRKRLNNKGFTLIELLAVVVILAVVMGIAMNSVLSSMNKSRGGSLQDSAMVIANAFTQKYTESLVDGVPSDVYGDVIGAGNGYNFQGDAVYNLNVALADTFNISASNYVLKNGSTKTKVNGTTNIADSFVKFNATTGKFVVCLFANKTGSYFVDAYKVVKDDAGAIPQIGSTGITPKVGEMYACSDGSNSWK